MSRARIALGMALVALAIPSPVSASPESWRWPVGAPRTIVRPYVAPATPYSTGHRGVDLLVSEGAVTAPASGTVRFAGIVVNRAVISIDHGNGVISSYEPVVTDLQKGDPVSRGDPIGQAIPGHCSVLCVHFGVRVNGQYISPLSLLDEIPYAVLLPTRR